MARALIVDDERLARTELRRLLSVHGDIEIAGEARDADEAEQLVLQLTPDLLFLDIQMPGCSGFDLLERLPRIPLVVFTTAYDAYALQAFEVNALAYLMKPIEPRRLAAALDRVRAQMRPAAAPTTPLDRVFVREGERCWLVRCRDLMLLESEGNYTRVYFASERPLIQRSLKSLEERLDSTRFFRASRKHLVNLDWVERLDPAVDGGLVARLRTGLEVDVSRRQAQRLIDLLKL